MTGKNIITINGRHYDAISGVPMRDSGHRQLQRPQVPGAGSKPHRAFSDISGPAPLKRPVAPAKAAHDVHAHNIHQHPQKSQTLHRAALKKPEPLRQLTPAPVKILADTATLLQHHRSPVISKFGPAHHTDTIHATTPIPAASAPHPTAEPRIHPVVASALANRTPQPAVQSSRELKEALIRERLAEATPNTERPVPRHGHKQSRLAAIMTSSLALLLLAGYLTYINLPNISMRVAAVRAGIAANYPNYQPDGYHFAGPIAYQPGEVNITFKSNTNDNDFTIRQKSSSWDSQAVLDNYVSKQTGTYLTYQERGLTIYAFGNHAAWVNGGLLYTIDGDAQLSSDQLLHIATSM